MTSNDAGATWQDISSTFPKEVMPYSIWANEDAIYLGSADGLFNGNATGDIPQWSRASLDKRNIGAISAGAAGPYVLSHGNGFYQLRKNTWHAMHETLPDKDVYAVIESGNALYAGCPSGMYRSDNAGKSWRHVFDKGAVYTICEIDGILLTYTTHRIWRSANAGISWEAVYSGTGEPFCLQALGSTFIAIVGGGNVPGMEGLHTVYHSTDAGLTWAEFNADLPQELMRMYDLRQVDNYLVAVSHAGLFRSSDHGLTWDKMLSLPEEGGRFLRLAVDDQKVYAIWIVGC